MDLPVFGFNDTPADRESELFLFAKTAGTGNISYKVRPTKAAGIADNLVYFESIGFAEIGALKDDMLIQVVKGNFKSNYSGSLKRECNFTLINTKCDSSSDNNITNTIAANGTDADFIVMDKANCFIYELRDMKIESEVKIQGKKTTDLNFKCSGDGFTIPLKAIKFLGETGEVVSTPNIIT